MASSHDGDSLAASLEMIEQLQRTLIGVLDIRGVFERVSEIARKVLDHDAMGLPILTEDREHIMPMATAGLPAGTLPPLQPIDPVMRWLMTEPWDWHILEDLQTQHELQDLSRRLIGGYEAYVRLGYRTLLRVPIRLNGQLVGLLGFFSRRPAAYSRADALVACRIADHVALALSHQRLAEEKSRAAEFRERTSNLELLAELLDTLTDVRDVQELFDRASQVVQRVLPHDLLDLVEINEEGDRARVFITGGPPDIPKNFEVPVPDPELIFKPWDVLIFDNVPTHPFFKTGVAAKAGLESALSVPIRFGGRLRAAVNFFSRQPARFSRDDLPVAQRIAGHMALMMSHARLSEEARQRQALEARASALEVLDQSLASLTDTGPLADQVNRISAVTRSVLSHDAMVLPVLLPDGRHVRRYASSGLDMSSLPDVIDISSGFLSDPDWKYDRIDDAAAHSEPQNKLAAKQGFRSVLRVPVRLKDRFMGAVVFLSRTPALYKQSDIQVARRVAGRIALTLEREHGLEEGKRADAAAERAARLESRVRELTEELDARTGYRRVIGQSASWRQVLTQATQVASTETTVLLLGESGTGKEVVGRFLHRASKRRDGPFVALNCAALPEHLLEAELFGYERGAFTGAMQSKPGQLEQAAGGTLFLDEVGEMSLTAQAKLLRVLQEREFQRLGGTRVLKTDARVVAATNRDLHKAMSQGIFREDLYYRLAVFAIRLPALRERRDDILALSEAFLAEFGRTLGRPPSGISKDARARLMDYHWPGNVRELRNVLERAAILCDGGLITADLLALTVSPSDQSPKVPTPASMRVDQPSAADELSSMERAMLERALHDARYNKSKAAKTLGLTRSQLYVRMRRYGLE